ncbi:MULTISPECIES: type IA DNA topoisomerase [unclassified Aerococcus]|uniref:type IA DNA topoisomerase n=1 Tax=unclassified Aerococcus TaxID=2618060 RepID=UPI0008A621D4|nr:MULTISPECIES: type IA DNA topoisomerase [unclassified Aerococcus]MDK6679219.1 DNA topoisomerase III [Aerococcus sp. UMB8608]MDK6685939.1 DNA topoisomerase III [Aerococcus sp. UMB8623]MDK6939294.1 DNA topoisomerase III [Aerococcus sp. UMB8487]OFK21282.1 hypothetical protein HMPREF2829_03830 [Aerococcus sp. HMSC072A12]OFR32562.1 hypothetical protein HMPREF2892_08085 [Aerococcus sp. HMSC061A03]
MKCVILAEKPSQAKNYAEAFRNSNKNDGYFEIKDELFANDTVKITFGFGHLVSLAPPAYYNDLWGTWDLKNLPIIPDQFKYIVDDSKKKQFSVVSRLIKEAELIIIATDCDREGENIAWSIINEVEGIQPNKKYFRLWINSLEKQAIRDGFQHLQPAKKYYPLYVEAETRKKSDWLLGMNASPLVSLSLQNKGLQGTFSIGRVQTPTLYMLFDRERKIANFEKEKYFELVARIGGKDELKAKLNPNLKFKSKEEIGKYMQNFQLINQECGQIISIKSDIKEINSPQLFSLSSLQSEVNKKFKLSAQETLSVVQKLYELKYISYPRTSSNYITENELSYLNQMLPSYLEWLKYLKEFEKNIPGNRFVNSNKVIEHHAIIPTRIVPRKNDLKKHELEIYNLILVRTCAIYLPPKVANEIEILIQIGLSQFVLKDTTISKFGWQDLYDSTDKSEQQKIKISEWKEGEPIEIKIIVEEKETQPPKLYTEGQLITAMKNVGKVFDSESKEILKDINGIGTEATRAGIIESLKKREYIFVKNNKVQVTDKGKILCQSIESEKLLTSPEMTAKWEEFLKKIGNNRASSKIFLERIISYIDHLIASLPTSIADVNLSSFIDNSNSISCPICKNKLIEKNKFYGCSNYPKCYFTVPKKFSGKKLSYKQIDNLCEGKIIEVKGIKNKKGVSYGANLKINDEYKICIDSFLKKDVFK